MKRWRRDRFLFCVNCFHFYFLLWKKWGGGHDSGPKMKRCGNPVKKYILHIFFKKKTPLIKNYWREAKPLDDFAYARLLSL